MAKKSGVPRSALPDWKLTKPNSVPVIAPLVAVFAPVRKPVAAVASEVRYADVSRSLPPLIAPEPTGKYVRGLPPRQYTPDDQEMTPLVAPVTVPDAKVPLQAVGVYVETSSDPPGTNITAFAYEKV
jgi:hypothetical protein